ncbi:MAG: hypothetical protein ACK56F_00600 [bacterium]
MLRKRTAHFDPRGEADRARQLFRPLPMNEKKGRRWIFGGDGILCGSERGAGATYTYTCQNKTRTFANYS